MREVHRRLPHGCHHGAAVPEGPDPRFPGRDGSDGGEPLTFEPAIAAFCCNWCGYSAADQAGSAKLEYPAGLRIVRLQCTGMMDPYFVLRAFERGYDGGVVGGFPFGSCHYKSGNHQARDELARVTPVL